MPRLGEPRLRDGSAWLVAALIVTAVTACGPRQPATTASAAPPPATIAPANPDADSARAFLANMYSHYGGDGDPPTFANPGAWFDPDLAALLSADDKRSKAGIESALAYDPICACRSAGGLRAAIEVTRAAPDAATAIATVTYPGPPPPDGPSKITFDLVKANDQWRIHDVHETDAPSLKALLTRSNASAAKSPDDE